MVLSVPGTLPPAYEYPCHPKTDPGRKPCKLMAPLLAIAITMVLAGMCPSALSEAKAQAIQLETIRGPSPDHPCRLIVHGPEGMPLDIQISGDLLNWTTLATVTNVAGLEP
jgi:hypothetical protein